MNIQKFKKLRPSLYHLTDRRNIVNITSTRVLLSTKRIIERSNITDKDSFLRRKRDQHEIIETNGFEYCIRDQQPISMLALSKCLEGGWSADEFIEHLNKRVYFWCTAERLSRHFDRYSHENPVIIRCKTDELLALNGSNVEYSRINSGATRANAHLGGIAPYRGPRTFLPGDLFPFTPGKVVELTVVDQCLLPEDCSYSYNPHGPWYRLLFD